MRLSWIAPVAAAMLLSLASVVPAQEPAQPAAVVDMTFGLRFDPAEVRIRVGETVEWRNKAFLRHTVTFDPSKAADPTHVSLPEGVTPFDSGEVAGGGTWRHTFTAPGRYEYVCVPHEGQAMRGVVIVTPR